MSHAVDPVRKALDKIEVVDPHCHMRPDKPSADTLADIVLYHHVWIELVSSGMPEREVSQAGLPHEVADPDMAPLERVRRALPYLKRIGNTTLGLYLRWLLEDLYGLGVELTESNLEEAAALVEVKGRDPSWTDEVLHARCGVEASITVEGGGRPFASRIHRAREWAPVNLARGKSTPSEVLAGFEKQFGREIATAVDYADFVAAGVAELHTDDIRLLGMWVDPRISIEAPTDRAIDAVIRKAKDKAPLGPDELGDFCRFGVTRLLEVLELTSLRTVHVLVGADVLPPHRSITQWHGCFPEAMGRIAGRFADFRFMLSPASDAFTQDAGILAKHIPNISVAAYWWHVLYPFYLCKAIETRIDMIPMNKIVAFFSDAYHAEWCYPKLRMVKQIWAEVLTERVAKGWMTADIAIDLVRHAFYENPKRICLS